MNVETNARPVLVAGGAGYIGSHTVRLLERRGVPVVVVDDLSTGHAGALRVPIERGNLGDRAFIDGVFRKHAPRAVIHFAAKCYVGESVTDPARYYEHNVVATFTLLEAMRAAKCNALVFSSTCATYGDPVKVPMGEDHPQHPISPYGRTKLHMEHMIADYGRAYGLRWAALRYFNAAGASPDGDLGEDHEPETHLIPLVLQVALGLRKEILLFGDDYPTPDGTCVRDYVHVDDLATAHLGALASLEGGRASLVANLGTGRGYSVLEVVERARALTGHPIPARVVERRAGDPPELVSGGTAARELLGWAPERSDLDTILADAWRFHSARPRGFAEQRTQA